LCLFSSAPTYDAVQATFSIPPLQKLALSNISIDLVDLQRIFQEVASTLMHLTIYEMEIVGDLKDLNVLFTALETCYIDLDRGEYQVGIDECPVSDLDALDSKIYKKLFGAISGSEKTLKVFRSPSRNLKSNQLQFLKNTRILEFRGLKEVEFF
jgi:hypothetical protein